MTQIVSAPRMGLSVPTQSRQDIVSALLNDYGTSFGQSEDSTYALSPVPALKELPPPPPGSGRKPLPPGLTTKFQLRVEEPVSYDGRKNYPTASPTRITSRFISRSSKPRSLKLTVSNGATAIVPPRQAPRVPAKASPIATVPQPFDERPLPPPPPEKSEQRKPVPSSELTMGHGSSKHDRRDSKEPQESTAVLETPGQEARTQSAQATKRKPLPTVTKKLPSLADLKNGPRGRSVAPSSATSDADSDKTITRTGSRESSRTITTGSFARPSVENASSGNKFSGQRTISSQSSLPSQLPPTPDELPTEKVASTLPPPRKVYAGLPSNPRAKNQTAFGTHVHGKSRSGFDVMQKFAQTSNNASSNIIITPGTTPSPNKTEAVQKDSSRTMTFASNIKSRLKGSKSPKVPSSPAPEEVSQGSFNFTPPAPTPQQEEAATLPVPAQQEEPASLPPPASTSPLEPPIEFASQSQFSPRTSSRSTTGSVQSGPHEFPFSSEGEQETAEATEESDTEEGGFRPLTKAPISTEPRPLTAKQLNCYTNHATLSEYRSRFQTPGCQVCGQSERGIKSTCSWCMLYVCSGCRDELRQTPGRNVQTLLDKKAQGKVDHRPSVVMEGTEEGS